MLIRGEKAREQVKPAIDLLIEKFGKQNLNKETSAQYVSTMSIHIWETTDYLSSARLVNESF